MIGSPYFSPIFEGMLTITGLSIGKKGSTEKLVDNIGFHLESGQTLGVVGETGSGKSLTALSIMGLLPQQLEIQKGIILLDDKDITRLSAKEQESIRGQRISMIFQEPMTALNPVMRCGKQVLEVIRQHRKITTKDAKKEVLELFQKVRLPRPEKIFSAYPHEISGGQKQRIMIAMAMANKPDLLIADEPTTALDVTVQKEILKLLKALQLEYGMTLLFITHDLAVVAEIAEQVAVMHKGKIVESGPAKEIFLNPKHPYTKGLLSCRPPQNVRLNQLPTLQDFLNTKEEFVPDPVSSDARTKRLKTLYEKDPLFRVDALEKDYVLSKSFWGKPREILQAVNGVSFNVYPGETLGLVGESGCGKTTLGRSLLRLIDPDKGSILYQTEDLATLSRKAMKPLRKDLSIVFQDPYSSLNPRISIGEAIMEPMRVHKLYKSKKECREQAMELLQKTGLEEAHFYRYPHEFSGGQRQRIVIARALALQPKFIICDEAVSALDVSVQAVVLNLLNKLKSEFGFTYIFISHDLSVVRFMSDRIMVMKDGNIVEVGDADEVYHHPKEEYTRQLIAAVPNIHYSTI
ncbi:MAG: ABC transporter ATP-binding protein [Bacteroidales bacterium]|nr:ABC transporter ATP-binding protein [Bacteroidales bacterium]